ncbi:MAG: YybH family protein [Gemmatimonadaceae bacterium]
MIRAFAEAMRRGDSAAVVALLAPDAIILESGEAQSRLEYEAHHLPGDLAFSAAVARAAASPRIVVVGNVAWAWATGTVQGEYRGRAIRSATAELMVLSREPDHGWQIRAVHWSARPLR